MIDEALKLALEALESNTTNPVIDPDQAAIENQAINAIKQALAAPVQPVAWRLLDDEPGQTPRWQYYDKSDFKDGVNPMCVYPQLVALYTTPPAQPAPVPDLTHDQWDQWQDKHGLILEREALDHLRSMLYTTPPAEPATVQEPDWLDKEKPETDWDHVWLLIKAASYASARGHMSATTNWGAAMSAYLRHSTPPAAQPAAVQPVAHCEAGPAYCQQCHLEDRSLALAAAVRYVKNNTPKVVSDEICMALNTPPAQTAPVPLTDDQIRGLTPKPDGVAEGNVRRVEVLPGVMGTEFDEVDAWSMPLVLQIARAIEAAHGITKGQS